MFLLKTPLVKRLVPTLLSWSWQIEVLRNYDVSFQSLLYPQALIWNFYRNKNWVQIFHSTFQSLQKCYEGLFQRRFMSSVKHLRRSFLWKQVFNFFKKLYLRCLTDFQICLFFADIKGYSKTILSHIIRQIIFAD